jgi:hypothetical protein
MLDCLDYLIENIPADTSSLHNTKTNDFFDKIQQEDLENIIDLIPGS